MVQKNDSIYADPNSGGDDGFVDIDEFLSGIRQESINSGSMAEKVDSRTRSGSPRDSICSTEESSQGEHLAIPNLARASYLYDPRSDYAE